MGWRMASVLFLAGCGGDISVTATSRCDGLAQKDEASVDQPYDADGDGYFDAANPDCASVYAPEVLDCNDQDPEINPGVEELGCSGVDEDCDLQTPDTVDLDDDGYASAADADCIAAGVPNLDCDDNNSEIHPNAVEQSCNLIDDDCRFDTPDGVDNDSDSFTACEDCDDSVTTTYPGASEVECNDTDDDCDPLTLDGIDGDGDGFTSCYDCNDGNPSVVPGGEELCDDAIDNDCDLAVDEDCNGDFTDVWSLDQTLSYSCAFGLVSISFNTLVVVHSDPNISFSSSGGSQPGTMTGTVDGTGSFLADTSLPGGCTETYTLSGDFLDDSTFEATFVAAYAGSCFGCVTQTWSGVVGTR